MNQRSGVSIKPRAVPILDGTVIGSCQERHRQSEFIRFLERVERSVPKRRESISSWHNYATHKHPALRE